MEKEKKTIDALIDFEKTPILKTALSKSCLFLRSITNKDMPHIFPFL